MSERQSFSYVYFAFKGDDFDPAVITKELKINPTNCWKKGDKGVYIQKQRFSCWELCSSGDELLDMDKLATEVIQQLKGKIKTIKRLKKELDLNTVLEIVMYIDLNEEKSTPYVGHDADTIEFLYKTGTITDVGIYRYNSGEK